MADTNSFDCDRNLSKKAAVILSGCGVMDGSEIHEAVVTILSLIFALCSINDGTVINEITSLFERIETIISQLKLSAQ